MEIDYDVDVPLIDHFIEDACNENNTTEDRMADALTAIALMLRQVINHGRTPEGQGLT